MLPLVQSKSIIFKDNAHADFMKTPVIEVKSVNRSDTNIVYYYEMLV